MPPPLDGLDGLQIYVKRKKLPPEHHGGAWKVAYADFVTAMMAFFLLLWILNAVNEEQMYGLTFYYADELTQDNTVGTLQHFEGVATMKEGRQTSTSSPKSVSLSIPSFGVDENNEKHGKNREDRNLKNLKPSQPKYDKDENNRLVNMQNILVQSIQENPELNILQNNILIDNLPEGLRILILDHDKQLMFEEGSTALTSYAKRLLALMGTLIMRLPNSVTISGHTAAESERQNASYGEWELSSDRAIVAAEWLQETGLNVKRIANISGKGDSEPLSNVAPSALKNNRISLLLIRQSSLASFSEDELDFDRVE